MPCYSKWSDNLDEKSEEFASKQQSLMNDYDILKRVISFYYAASERETPTVNSYRPRLKIKQGEDWSLEELGSEPHFLRWELSGSAPVDEGKIINKIAMHVLCDGRNWIDLWNIYSVIPMDNSELNFKRIADLVAAELRNITNEPIYGQIYEYCDFPR